MTTRLGERILDRAAGSRPIPGNAVDLLIDGPEAYPAMLDVIARAERWIHFENYIIRSDATGWRFAEALAKRAKEGIAVRVLADWFGCIGTRQKLWRYLRAAGIEVRLFQPFTFVDPLSNIGRDHRKLVTADGRDAVIGGLCIGDEWSGDVSKGALPWRDTAVRIRGPACGSLDAAFGRAWRTVGEGIADSEGPGVIAEQGEAAVRVVAGEPGQARTYRLLTAVAAGAESRLWITDAYLAPPPPLRTALIDAARDGCDLQLLVPGMSDLPLVRNLSRVGYRDLLREGIRIHEWQGPMLHAKTFVADGRMSRVGSTNLNYASLLGNWELDVLVEDPALGLALEGRYRKDVLDSVEVVRRVAAAPVPLRGWIPEGIAVPKASEISRHRATMRERRRRATITLYSIAAGASRSLFIPLFVALLVLAITAFFLPRTVAAGMILVAFWLLQSAARQARRGRPDVSPTDWARKA